MGKKTFRPSRTWAPDYPRLREVESGPLSRWGLIALGGLLAGDAGCVSAQADSKSPTAQPSKTARATKAPPAPDGGTPSIPIPGGIQPQRIDAIPAPEKRDDSKGNEPPDKRADRAEKTDKAAKTEKKDNAGTKGGGSSEATGAPPPAVPPSPTGTMPAPRVHKKGAK
jgi:hypothetical protein